MTQDDGVEEEGGELEDCDESEATEDGLAGAGGQASEVAIPATGPTQPPARPRRGIPSERLVRSITGKQKQNIMNSKKCSETGYMCTSYRA